jgi:DNA-binding transcriptional ArsR family regulator
MPRPLRERDIGKHSQSSKTKEFQPMAVSRRSPQASTDRHVQAEAFLDRLFGRRKGIVAAAYGIDGHFTATGSYTFGGRWKPVFFDWPSDRPKFIKRAVDRLAPDYDVYLIPNLRSDRSAKVEFGLECEYIWADIDKVTEDAWKRLGAVLSQGSFLVRSGGDGHLHAYLHLDGHYQREVYEGLNQRFAGYIGGDPKFRDNSHLRLPGTLNHKGRAAGTGSSPVVFEEVTGSNIPPWSPADLRRALGPLPATPGERKKKNPSSSKNTMPKGSNRRRPEIVLVDAEPIPSDLPDDVLHHIHFTDKKKVGGGDQSRSGQLYGLVAVMVSHGYTDGQIMGVAEFSEPGQDKWSDEIDLRYATQRCINKLRPKHRHVGLTCREAGCPPGAGSRSAGEVSSIQIHFRSHYRSSRTLSSDTKIMDALLRRSAEIGSIELDMSRRELSRLAGVCRNTADKGLHRLIKSGYVEQLLLRHGKPMRVGRGPIHTRAYRYRVKCPDIKVEPHNHSVGFFSDVLMCGSTLMMDESLDVWRFRGLMSARRTYGALLDGHETVMDISEIQGQTTQTVNRHLKKLQAHGLAQKKPDGKSWMALERSPAELADELGTLGMGKKQADYQAWESEKYVIHRALRDQERREMDDRMFQELVDRGYRWTGPYNCLLTPPPKAWIENCGPTKDRCHGV